MHCCWPGARGGPQERLLVARAAAADSVQHNGLTQASLPGWGWPLLHLAGLRHLQRGCMYLYRHLKQPANTMDTSIRRTPCHVLLAAQELAGPLLVLWLWQVRHSEAGAFQPISCLHDSEIRPCLTSNTHTTFVASRASWSVRPHHL